MLMQKAFKYCLRPVGAQLRTARCTAGCRRYVMNRALAMQQSQRASGGKYLSYADMCTYLLQWKSEPGRKWLKEAPAQSLQQALKDLERAFQNFFAGRASYPTFKKKGRGDSFRYPRPSQIHLDQANNRLFLPKLGWLRYRNSRAVTGELRNVTVSATGGKWYASIQTQQEVPDPVPTATSAVGADVGITRFATLSDGGHIEPLNPLKRLMLALAKAQRKMARKVKFSQNWKKAKARVTRLHSAIANARRDFLHKTTSTLCKNQALVAIEDLQIKNMSASAKGTTAEPGKNVRQKAGLNRSILDQGWGEFRRQLEYKLAWAGGWVIAVPPQNTSRTCPCCGHIAAGNRPSQAVFLCQECWYENNADEVAAINILDRALAMLAEVPALGKESEINQGPDSARLACEVSGAARPPASGTHREYAPG
jgi:putative transposase